MAAGLLPQGTPKEISSRGLTLATCKKWGYTFGKLGVDPVQIANYRDDAGNIVGQKARTKDKDFKVLGSINGLLYGKHLWRAKGKRVFVTEGEIDALTVSQVLGHKWPVVSLPNGAQGARKALAANLEWLNGFDQVTLVFDMDDPGRDAAADCTSLFPPGKLSVAALPLKDPNKMLQDNRTEELIEALWGAKPHRPDGLKTVGDVRDRIFANITTDLTWFDERLNAITYGRRYGECVAFGAGTGVGKTTFLMQQLAHDIQAGHSVGVFAFEQDVGETVRLVGGQIAGKTFHIPDGSWTDEELHAVVDKLEADNRLHLYDHFGACEWDVVKERIRYLRHDFGVRIFLVDHLTALAAAEDNERTGLERITAEISSLAQELGIWIGVVSHLATPEGKPHEEGGRVMIRHFKGSRAIGFWMHEIYGLERNQQADDETEKRHTIIRILKHRKVGRTVGSTFPITYEDSTGRLIPADDADDGPADNPFKSAEGEDF
jgi:twinkle protein